MGPSQKPAKPKKSAESFGKLTIVIHLLVVVGVPKPCPARIQAERGRLARFQSAARSTIVIHLSTTQAVVRWMDMGEWSVETKKTAVPRLISYHNHTPLERQLSSNPLFQKASLEKNPLSRRLFSAATNHIHTPFEKLERRSLHSHHRHTPFGITLGECPRRSSRNPPLVRP